MSLCSFAPLQAALLQLVDVSFHEAAAFIGIRIAVGIHEIVQMLVAHQRDGFLRTVGQRYGSLDAALCRHSHYRDGYYYQGQYG